MGPIQHSLFSVNMILQDLLAENSCLRESLHNMYQELRTMLNHLQNSTATDPVSVFDILDTENKPFSGTFSLLVLY